MFMKISKNIGNKIYGWLLLFKYVATSATSSWFNINSSGIECKKGTHIWVPSVRPLFNFNSSPNAVTGHS